MFQLTRLIIISSFVVFDVDVDVVVDVIVDVDVEVDMRWENMM